MSLSVNIETIVDELSILLDESCAYINRKTGEVFSLTEEEISLAETDDDGGLTPEWQTEIIDDARRVMMSDDILTLPTRFEIDEYAIMEQYCLTVVDHRIRNALSEGIKGRGAFRRFKDMIHREGIEGDWYRYRDRALGEIVRVFLEDNKIPYSTALPQTATLANAD